MSHLLDKIKNKIHTHEVVESAPVVKERIHEHTEHIDRTHVEEAHEKIKVEQIVQPIVDERREGLKTRTEDHGVEVHEHGRGGLDSTVEAELEARRAKVAATGGVTTDRVETQTSSRPDIDVSSRTHTVEQVIPVVERDIYKPEVIEHHKKQVEIIHDRPEILGTKVAPTITVDQWKSQGHGKHVDLDHATSFSSSSVHTSSSKANYSSSSSSSSSSSDEEHNKLSSEARLSRKTARRSRMSKEERKERQHRRMQRPGYTPHKKHGSHSHKSHTESYGAPSHGTETYSGEKPSLMDKAKHAVGLQA